MIVGTGNRLGISTLARYIFRAVRMSQFILLCSTCGGEITHDSDLRATPGGRIVCDHCARDCYIDVPLT